MKRVALLALLLPVAVVAATPQRQFKTSTTVVRLEVGVRDDAGSVHGLLASDFVVEDRGARQSIRAEELTDAPLDVVLVAPPLAGVAFVVADQTNRFMAGVTALLDQVEDRDRLGVVLAGSPPRRIRTLEPGRSGIGLDALQSVRDSYSSSFDAIAMGLHVFDSSDRRRALVAFTNTADFRSVITAETAADLAKRLDNALILVGLPVSINATVTATAELAGGMSLGDPVEGTVRGRVLPVALERFAKESSGQLINLGEAQPSVLMKRLFESLRSYYVVTYELPEGKGWHPVKVKVNRRGVKVAVRQGYFVE